MADNMIELVARINTDTSADEINKTDIPDLQKQIKKLHIQCNLDTNSINALKKQFSNLGSSLNSNGIKKVTNDIVNKFNDSFNLIGKVGETSKKQFNAQTKQMLQEFKEAWQKGLDTGDFSAYNTALDKLEQRVREFNRGDISQLKDNIAEIRRYFTDGSKVSIGDNLKGWLDSATGSNELTRKYLDAVYGKNNYTIGGGNAGYDTLFQKDDDAVESIINAAQKIIQYQQKIKDTGWGLEELDEIGINTQEYLQAQEKASENIEDKLREIVGLSQRVREINEWQDIDIDYDFANEISEGYEEAAKQSDELRRKQELLWQNYEKFIAKVEKANLEVNSITKREEIISGELVNYNERFLDVMDSEIINTKSLSEARDILAAMTKQFDILNAHAESELPQNAMENLIQRIAKTDSQIKVLTLDFDNLNDVPQKLQQSFDNLQASMEGFNFNSDFRTMSTEEITKTVQQYTQIRIALNDTQSLMKVASKEESTFNKKLEAHTKEIQKQLDLKEKEVQKAKELNEIEFERKLDSHNKEIQKQLDLKEKQLQTEEKLRQQEEMRALNLSNRYQKLTADIKAYSAANERAVNSTKLMSNGRTFSDTWADIEKLAQSANLSDAEVKKLATDLQVFKKEARAAGVAGQSAFEKFLKSFKTMSSYITANMVFNYVKRSLRDMVNEVTTVDTAMTELRKVTEATNEEFEAFAISAGKTGRELGASVSDVIDATATFARLGESLPDAEELGRVATLYKNVGDGISETTAAEDIISTMKAFKIEAQDAITIVDKLNEVGKYCCP